MILSLITLLAAAQGPGQSSSITNPAPAGSPALWFSCLARDATGKIISGDVATLDCFKIVFQRFVFGAWMLAGITAAILIAYAGTQIVLAEGDAKKLEAARHILYYAVTGLIIVFLAAFIVSTIAYITGVDCLNVAGFRNCE